MTGTSTSFGDKYDYNIDPLCELHLFLYCFTVPTYPTKGVKETTISSRFSASSINRNQCSHVKSLNQQKFCEFG